MHTYRYLRTLLIVIFLSCLPLHGQATEKTSVEVRGSKFYLNGNVVKLPVAVSAIEKIIGRPDRTMEGARKVSTWDKLGLIGYQPTESDEFIEIGVILNIAENAFDFMPATLYRGSLIVDGVKITSASTLNAVNRQKKGGKFNAIPFVGMLSDYTTGGLYLVMWQQEKREASGSGKILQVNKGIARR